MLALIDADIVCYRVGFTTENEDLGIAKWRLDEMMDHILVETQATTYESFISDNKENNFRFELFPLYKANRVQPKPKHHEALKEHLITAWGAQFSHGMEADDFLGITQCLRLKEARNPEFQLEPSVICTIDKDLKQIPGLHYNFVKKVWDEVSPEQGNEFFYQQILIGDVSDNITGCWNIGPKKSAKILKGCADDCERLSRIFETYCKQEPERTQEDLIQHILLAGRLLKIKQKEDEPLWHFPLSSLMVE